VQVGRWNGATCETTCVVILDTAANDFANVLAAKGVSVEWIEAYPPTGALDASGHAYQAVDAGGVTMLAFTFPSDAAAKKEADRFAGEKKAATTDRVVADVYVFHKGRQVVELFASRKSADRRQTQRVVGILQGLFGKPRTRLWWA
jgi:hypothetical protein